MKLYRHYKNKPYKYIGEARHSETLEEVVIYETLYENPRGKIWVRPKPMFFESVEIKGQTIPRFDRISLKIEEAAELTEARIEMLAPLIEKTFGQWDPRWFRSRLQGQDKHYVAIAFVENQAVGFKLGYEHNPREFYSWLGGVVPEFRGLGVASDLMAAQHDWCRRQGYKKIKTKTQNRFREMFVLNLKHGFDAVGCEESDEGFKIVLEKDL